MAIAKILIVDDEEDIRLVGELALRRLAGWEVMLAANGTEALDRAAREQPDVILLDVMMPGMDGPGVLTRLREEPATARIPVIFLTARVQQAELDRYQTLGARGVIRKPFDAMGLADEVRRIVGDG